MPSAPGYVKPRGGDDLWDRSFWISERFAAIAYRPGTAITILPPRATSGRIMDSANLLLPAGGSHAIPDRLMVAVKTPNRQARRCDPWHSGLDRRCPDAQ
jgi:hypothetical protein